MAEGIIGLAIVVIVGIMLIVIGGSFFQASSSTQTSSPQASQVSGGFGWAFIIGGLFAVVVAIIALAKMFG